MPIATEAFKDRSNITSLVITDKNTVAYSTVYHGIRLLDVPKYKTKQKLTYDELCAHSTAFCFNENSLMAFATNNAIYVVSLKTNKLIKTIKVGKAIILELIFCDNYIIAGTNKGRVLQYRYNNSAQLARICSFIPTQKRETTNYVSALAVYENYLACTGHGGALYVFDVFSHVQRKTLIETGNRINALLFLDHDKLISADVHGNIIIHSLLEPQNKKKISAPFINVKQIISMPNPRYIAILGGENYISLIDIKDTKVAQTKYVQFPSTTTHMVLVNEGILLVALSNQTVMEVKLASSKQLRTALIYNDVINAYKLVEDEPMLKHTREYKLLEKRFDSLYEEAAGALISQNKTLALKTLSLVKQIPSKKTVIDELFTAYEQYSRFKLIYLEKKYALAYAMSEKYPPLKHSPLFIKIEEVWLDNFVNAQRHVLMGNIGNAQVLLEEYVTIVSKRDIITLLLRQDSDFLQFLKAINEKDFQILEELIQKHPNFTATPTYISLSQSTEKSIQKIVTFINEGKLLQAKELLQKFKNTSFIKNDLKKLHHHLQHMAQLKNAYKNNDFKTCYEVLDTYHHLNISELGILLNKHWIKLINTCEEYALKANPNAIKTTLNALLLVNTRTSRIGDLLRVSFHSKIKAYLAKRSFHGAQNIIYSYIDIFGSDCEIKSLMTTYEALAKKKLAITQDGNNLIDRDKWINSEVIVGKEV